MAFVDHFTHLYEIARHQLSYMELYNTQHAYIDRVRLKYILLVKFIIYLKKSLHYYDKSSPVIVLIGHRVTELQSYRVTKLQTPKGTQFVPDFNKLPYSLCSQEDYYVIFIGP